MWLSAASFGFALLSGQVASQLPAEERKAWDKIGQSMVVVESNGFATGTAVLLDGAGHFMAHRSVLMADKVTARLRSGKLVSIRLIFTDEPTQLSLLAADKWDESEMTPVVVSDGTGLVGRQMIAALPAGPIRGEFISTDRAGIVKPSLRYVPLSEIRFETPDQRFGGATVFSYDGKLTGVLSASLELVSPSGGGASDLARQLGNDAVNEVIKAKTAGQHFGPGSMTVGYSVGPEILARVVEGFRSPSHRPIHPSIGCFFRDTTADGALIEAVLPNSPSAIGGMRVGDLIIKANDVTVNGPFDLAVFLFRQKPGNSITLVARRGQGTVSLPIVVGKQE